MEVGATTPLWVAAGVLLHRRGEELFRLKRKVLHTFDPEDIHDLRVSSRRLREGLDLFAPCYPPASTNRLTRKVKRVTRFLGEIRNRDEAFLFCSALLNDLQGADRYAMEGLVETLARSRDKGLKGFRSELQRNIPPSLREACHRVIASPRLFAPPSGVDLFAPVSSFAAGAVTGRLAEVTEAVPRARLAGEVKAQHLLRIAVKHLRYRLEILSFLFGAGFREIHDTLKGYQDVLGRMNDLDVFCGIIRDAGLGASAERLVLTRIGTQREELFDDFTAMLATVSLEELGTRARSAW